jgi:CDP-diacylglycerol--serine O-phosphatidyltransferase
MKYIPNIITSLNLAAGFIAIIFAAGGNLVSASWIILIAMILDFLDGFAARLLKAYSALGKELDSLSDLVSFGVAPSLIMYMMLSGLEPVILPGLSAYRDTLVIFIIYIPVLMSVCAAFRLAKFNLDSSQATSFSGLPTPASALAVISVVIAGHYSDSAFIESFVSSPLALCIYTIIISLLMVSNLPLFSLKIKGLAIKGNEGRYLLAAMVLLSLIIFGISATPFIIPLYIMTSFVNRLF